MSERDWFLRAEVPAFRGAGGVRRLKKSIFIEKCLVLLRKPSKARRLAVENIGNGFYLVALNNKEEVLMKILQE
ncbi:MAG: hypothetical protein ACE362_14615 [Phaeodactylibacter xiamenensis]|uniref:hypothetical protein n=1 Tax=Phaeodactylibacter xiamenensis TaxID=1524460 RepID=UPI0005C67C44|nr:hypothetical protein [Phaeodactylibacter xiamenensis]MCR9053903.1 hypothetical protein [bacterium]